MSSRVGPDDNDIREEYDFSSAVRGKHAHRFGFSATDEVPPWFREAVHYDRQSWVSEALRQTQDLESLLVAYLSLAFQLDPREAGESTVDLLEHPSDRTLPRILEDLGSSLGSVPQDLESRLKRVFQERNWLVHRSVRRWGSEIDLDSIRSFVSRLQELSQSTAAVNQELEELMKQRFIRGGMTEREFRKKSDAVIREWLAA